MLVNNEPMPAWRLRDFFSLLTSIRMGVLNDVSKPAYLAGQDLAARGSMHG